MRNGGWPRSFDGSIGRSIDREAAFAAWWHGRISAIGRRYFRVGSMGYKEKRRRGRGKRGRKACTRPSMHAHTLEYRQFRWFRVADGLFECLVACAREYCRPSYAKLSRVSTIQCILRAVLHSGCVSWTANGRQRCVVPSLDKIFPTVFFCQDSIWGTGRGKKILEKVERRRVEGFQNARFLFSSIFGKKKNHRWF